MLELCEKVIQPLEQKANEQKPKLYEETAVMTSEEAQELIQQWNELEKRIDRVKWLTDPKTEAAIAQMRPIVARLHEAGYSVTADGQWYHPSDAK